MVCADSSEPALALASRSAGLNGVGERVRTRQGDAFETLRELRAEGERFDAIILDPPAFIKRRRDAKQGEKAYHRLNRLAMELLAPDGEFHEEYVLKLRGFEVLDEHASVGATGARNGSIFANTITCSPAVSLNRSASIAPWLTIAAAMSQYDVTMRR